MKDDKKSESGLADQPMSYSDLGALRVDDAGRLYWKGNLVKTESAVVLDWWQFGMALIVSGSTLSIAFFDFLRFFGWCAKC